MTNNTKLINQLQEVRTFIKDLSAIRKLIEKEKKKIDKAKKVITKNKIDAGIFNTQEGNALAKEFTATFRALEHAVYNLPNTQDESKKEVANYLANSLDFLEDYKEIFEIHREMCLIDNLINTTKSFKK